MAKKNKIVHANMMNYTLYDDIDVENRLFVTWHDFEAGMSSLCKQIREHIAAGNTIDAIYAFPRGGLCIGVKLSYVLKIPLLTSKEEITPQTLIVDDCVDSGKTLLPYSQHKTAVLYYKPASLHTPTFFYQKNDKQINFCWESIEERN